MAARRTEREYSKGKLITHTRTGKHTHSRTQTHTHRFTHTVTHTQWAKRWAGQNDTRKEWQDHKISKQPKRKKNQKERKKRKDKTDLRDPERSQSVPGEHIEDWSGDQHMWNTYGMWNLYTTRTASTVGSLYVRHADRSVERIKQTI